jgi:TonB family protein
MQEHHKKKHFLNLPKYPGGSEAFRKFISENVRYPDEALEARVEGTVIVEYEITDEGVVNNTHVIKSLGYGCDEEAVRVIRLLRFEKVKNRGLRVKMTTKTTIHFRPPQGGINISYVETGNKQPAKKEEPTTYGYTITF